MTVCIWVFTRCLVATHDPLLQKHRLCDLWAFAVQSDPTLKKMTLVKFYEQAWWTNPELWKSNPSDQHLLFELHLAGGADGALPDSTPACKP